MIWRADVGETKAVGLAPVVERRLKLSRELGGSRWERMTARQQSMGAEERSAAVDGASARTSGWLLHIKVNLQGRQEVCHSKAAEVWGNGGDLSYSMGFKKYPNRPCFLV